MVQKYGFFCIDKYNSNRAQMFHTNTVITEMTYDSNNSSDRQRKTLINGHFCITIFSSLCQRLQALTMLCADYGVVLFY